MSAAPARTLGIDLSVDDGKTAACTIAWPGDGSAEVVGLAPGPLDNTQLGELIGEVLAGGGAAGIDAPFSWPLHFREALERHGREGGWPVDYRDPRYQFRETDRFVEGCARRPLSVSTNLIGVTAMRCARLLQEVGERLGRRVDAAGGDGVYEVYPAAALAAWGGRDLGLDPQGYKTGAGAPARRAALVESLAERPWLRVGPDVRAACKRSDDVLDALVAALATRAAATGRSRAPETDAQREAARVEGWIHVPQPGSLDELA